MLFKVTTDPAPPNPKVSDTEFKLFFPSINRSGEWCTIEPFIQMAEDQEIIPAISQEFYDVLETEYQSSGTIADTNKAYTFRLLRTALAHYAMAIGMPMLNMRMGDGGVAENSSNDIIPVRQWVFQGSRWEILKQAYKYLDMALAHMESQVSAANVDYDTFANSDAYTISARFDNIGGLRIRAPVTMAGVKVGRVSDIGFDKETFEAVVELEISSDYRILPFDTSASILTAGLLGENYIGLDAGSDTEVLSEGDEVTFTQGALVLENLIGQFVASQGD